MTEPTVGKAAPVVHDRRCADRIRVRELARAGDPDQPDAGLSHRIALMVQEHCGHTPLKAQRLARGWTVYAAIRRFHTMCAEEKLGVWGLSERSWLGWEAGQHRPGDGYRDLLCRLFRCSAVQLGYASDHTPQPARPARPAVVRTPPPGADEIDLEVSMAAEESARFAERAEQSNVGPHTLEQFRADINRIVTVYENRPIYQSFVELRELRRRAFEKLEGRQQPQQASDLYLITGWLCGLLGQASTDLGRLDAAETHLRTAFLCADLAGHNGLRAWIRAKQGQAAYWDDRPQEAVQFAESGRGFPPESGTVLVRLAAFEATAFGRLRNREAVDAALGRAAEARQTVVGADNPGGIIVFSEMQQNFYAATARLWLGDKRNARLAERDADQAVQGYLADPKEKRKLGGLSLARLDRGLARLTRGNLDGTAADVRAVLEIGGRRPSNNVTKRLRQVRAALDQPRFRDDPLATDLRAEITAYTDRAPIPALPTPPPE